MSGALPCWHCVPCSRPVSCPGLPCWLRVPCSRPISCPGLPCWLRVPCSRPISCPGLPGPGGSEHRLLGRFSSGCGGLSKPLLERSWDFCNSRSKVPGVGRLGYRMASYAKGPSLKDCCQERTGEAAVVQGREDGHGAQRTPGSAPPAMDPFSPGTPTKSLLHGGPQLAKFLRDQTRVGPGRTAVYDPHYLHRVYPGPSRGHPGGLGSERHMRIFIFYTWLPGTMGRSPAGLEFGRAQAQAVTFTIPSSLDSPSFPLFA
ncbi:uncharacterized protein LOC141515569 [Macrotis lagotis]|uniref:uncharacterized protein LOC141515569 n=1 Tax=Macrotis lagotis TaxID=92651 RepID=UPI003D6915F1